MAGTAVAFRCNDYVLMAATGLDTFYYIKISEKEDKITQLNSHQMVACIGENGPRVNFTEYLKCNLALNRVRQHGREGSCHATANFIRGELASALRSRDGLYEVNCLFAGYDFPISEDDDLASGFHLYYLDYLGTLQEVPYGAHGYGAPFVISLLDRFWRADLTHQEGLELLQKCLDEIKKRVVISNEYFVVKAVTAKGIERIESVH